MPALPIAKVTGCPNLSKIAEEASHLLWTFPAKVFKVNPLADIEGDPLCFQKLAL